jgi:hypothetical protein
VAKILGKDVQASWDDLKNMNLNPKNFSKRDVEEKSSEFTYSKIIAYIDERLNKSKEFDANFLLKIIPEYADLSSFVHGGPLSDKLMASLKSGEEVIEKIQNRVDLAFMTFHAAVQMAFLVFYQHDRRFEKPYLELKILMDALSKANAKDHEQSKS